MPFRTPSVSGIETAAKAVSGTVRDARILIVDDLQSSRTLIGAILGSAGFADLHYAADGREALEKVAEVDPDIIVLDIVMPNMNGFEVCQRVRHKLKNDVPILIQTGLQEGDHRVRAFEEGASDVVSKPINPGELISRVRLHLERRQMIDRLTLYQTRMEEELRTAQAMQEALLTSAGELAALAVTHEVRFETVYQASNKLGGDLWKVLPIDDERLALITVDLSGHGVTAALNAFRLHDITNSQDLDRSSPSAWLAGLNNRLHAILSVEHFATGFYGVYDRTRKRLRYASAGAPPPILVRADGSVSFLDVGGLILGCVSGTTYEEGEVELAAGDRILLYSDALYEDFSAPNRTLDPEGLLTCAQVAHKADHEPRYCEAMLEAVFGEHPESFADDLTMVLMEVEPERAVEPVRIALDVSDPDVHEKLTSVLKDIPDSLIIEAGVMESADEIELLISDNPARGDLMARALHTGSTLFMLITDRPEIAGADLLISPAIDADEFDQRMRTAIELVITRHRMRAQFAGQTGPDDALQEGEFSFSRLSEAKMLATRLAMACPNSDMVSVGLQELLVNAVEHGNLRISGDEKQALLETGRWREEVERRLADPLYRGRRVKVSFHRGPRRITITITDDGEGFDHAAYLTANATDRYQGRGIALARDLCFSSVEFIGDGSTVIAKLDLETLD